MTQPQQQEQVFTLDYTDLDRHVSRVWRANDLKLTFIGGVVISALKKAGIASLVILPVLAVVSLVFGVGVLPGIGIGIVLVVAVYFRFASEPAGGMSLEQRWRLRRSYKHQPKVLSGLGEDIEPSEFTWLLILWRPNHKAKARGGEI